MLVGGAALTMLSNTLGRVRAMNHIAGAEDELGDPAPLWVTVECLRQSRCFELDGHSRHCVVIGSSPDADLRVQGKLSTPIQCNLEREGDDVWLIPGWPTNHIRIDSVLVERPVKLWRRCTMEIEGIRLEVRVREEPPTSPDIELLDPPHAAGGPTRISVREIIAIERDDRRQRIATAHGTVGPDARLSASTQWLTTASARRNGVTQSRWGSGSEAFDGPPSSTSPTAVSMRHLANDSPRVLARLGLLTRRRPWMVATGALLGASAITTILHLGSLLIENGFLGERPAPEQAMPLSGQLPCPSRAARAAGESVQGCGRAVQKQLGRIVASVGRREGTEVITLAVTQAAAGAPNLTASSATHRISPPAAMSVAR